ncbi:VOC family protein [Phycicoccus sp. HDW14]|uniref:VOC family protein n=1 Tax=Phycicoccus sp. HDW14 TaxID=2714941 RepID=UPI001F0D45C4|nr:VOC family protein [Phycicoccus sp. HDW14]
MSHTHHAIDYVELGAPDLAPTRAFYEQAFGWTFTEYGPDYLGYRVPGRDDEAGGIDAGREPGTGGPLVLLFSDDLDATVQAVLDAGGTVSTEPYAFPGGRRFYFRDPAGNELGAWQPAE